MAPALGAREFEQIRNLAHGAFGLDLKPGKEDLVASRLRRLLRKDGFPFPFRIITGTCSPTAPALPWLP